MITELPAEPEQLVALGACAGAQVLVVCLCVFIANAYRERALLLHGAATITGVLATQMLVGGYAYLAQAVLLAVLAINAIQLLEVVSHAVALRAPRRWLAAISLGLLPLLAVLSAVGQWHLLLPGLGAWGGVVGVVLLRAWPQSPSWVRWLLAGEMALALGAGWLGWRSLDAEPDPALPLAALLTVWTALVFIATAWRGRIFSETRVRIDARNTTDPLTGLPMPRIFYDRVQSVRNLISRYGHSSVLMLVHIDNLPRLATEFGPEVAESAVLVAANRIRQALREGDVAARLSHSRIGVLAEGMAVAEGTSEIASRILVAGLKEPLPAAPTEFLHFRIVLTSVPVSGEPPKALLQRLATFMDEHLKTADERRILAVTSEELQSA